MEHGRFIKTRYRFFKEELLIGIKNDWEIVKEISHKTEDNIMHQTVKIERKVLHIFLIYKEGNNKHFEGQLIKRTNEIKKGRWDNNRR